jgi:hypothetical protein
VDKNGISLVIDIRISFVPSGLELNWAWFQTLACLANILSRFATITTGGCKNIKYWGNPCPAKLTLRGFAASLSATLSAIALSTAEALATAEVSSEPLLVPP